MSAEEGHIEKCWEVGRNVELHEWEHMMEEVSKMQQQSMMVVGADEVVQGERPIQEQNQPCCHSLCWLQ